MATTPSGRLASFWAHAGLSPRESTEEWSGGSEEQWGSRERRERREPGESEEQGEQGEPRAVKAARAGRQRFRY